MFNNINELTNSWVNKRLDLLLASSEIMNFYNPNNSLNSLLKTIENLNPTNQRKLFRDAIFNKWLNDLNEKSIACIEKNESLKDIWLLDYAYNLSLLLTKKDALNYQLLVNNIQAYPLNLGYFDDNKVFHKNFLKGIRDIFIVKEKYSSLFNHHGELDIELDYKIDTNNWLKNLKSALDYINSADNKSIELSRNLVSYIVPLKQRLVIQNLSFSSRNLPNVIFKSNESSNLIFAETIIHEADHQLFYILEDHIKIWKENPKFQNAVHYSPWRDDLRPLDGVLRGLSAFVRVSNFYANLSKTNIIDTEIINTILLRIVQCDLAIITLKIKADFDVDGEKYFDELRTVLNNSKKVLFQKYSNSKNIEYCTSCVLRHFKKHEATNNLKINTELYHYVSTLQN